MEKTKATWMIAAEVELHYKTTVKPSERPKVTASADSYQVLLNSWNENTMELQETFKVLLLNQSNRVLGVFEASNGGITATVADPRHILIAAIKTNAVAIILAHNHPSGNVEPSTADKNLTTKIREAAQYFDMRVLDHIILSKDSYYSFADNGLL